MSVRRASSVCAGVLFFLVSIVAHDGFGKHYTTDEFKQHLPTKDHFVMFYAPWCGHCKRLAPSWDELEKKFENSEVGIAQVDCTKETALCSDNDITGYPTLKLFKKGDSAGIKFQGSRDVSSLKAFIHEQLGTTDTEAEDGDLQDSRNKLVELTEDNFHEHTKSGKHFIKFFAPWCGHCQKLAPTWEELAQSIEDGSGVSVGKVDCTVHRSVCNEFEIKGYPTMLWIEDGAKVDKYQGGRNLEDLKEYVSKQSRTGSEKTEQPEQAESSSPVLNLSSETFEDAVNSGTTFVKFFAPWCGHCKRLAPTWEELAAKFKSNDDVQIAKVDCTISDNKELCNAQEVNGFPTIFIYRDGKKVTEYNGSRSLDDLHQFVLMHSDSNAKDEL